MSEIANILLCMVLVQCGTGILVMINTYNSYKFMKHRIELDKKNELREDRAYKTRLDNLGEKK